MTLPNKITLARIACLPVVIALFYSSHFDRYRVGFILAWVFGISDFIDGYLARKLGQVSLMGKILDPIADKLFVLLMSLYFVDVGTLPAWFLILLVFREFVISDFRLLAYHQGKEVAVSRGGKMKAIFQYFLLGFLGTMKLMYFDDPAYRSPAAWNRVEIAGYYALLVGTLAFTLVSLVEYFWANRDLLKSPKLLQTR